MLKSGGMNSMPISQTFPLMISSDNQILKTRNKLGQQLYKSHHNDFDLDDPYMHESRFHVEYHRLHDPALKSYFELPLVKENLIKSGMLTNDDDVICSVEEFNDYMRYLNSLQGKENAAALKAKANIFFVIDVVQHFILFLYFRTNFFWKVITSPKKSQMASVRIE